jgi:hypothetical protein
MQSSQYGEATYDTRRHHCHPSTLSKDTVMSYEANLPESTLRRLFEED